MICDWYLKQRPLSSISLAIEHTEYDKFSKSTQNYRQPALVAKSFGQQCCQPYSIFWMYVQVCCCLCKWIRIRIIMHKSSRKVLQHFLIWMLICYYLQKKMLQISFDTIICWLFCLLLYNIVCALYIIVQWRIKKLNCASNLLKK